MMIYDDVQFPDRTILEITFLNKSDFYDISIQNRRYTIVGGDKDISTNLVGIADDEKVYYITTDDGELCYISPDIRTFIKQLLLFEEYTDTEDFRRKILELDKNSLNDKTFWAEVYEEIEYGII